MELKLERLAPRLESELGAGIVNCESSALKAHLLDGKTPALVCSPAMPEQVATILRVCAEAKAAVSPWGGGTGANVGNAPRQAWVAIDLGPLNRVIEHDPANLTVTVQSGITLAALREHLSSQRQFLPFDAPYPAQATLGGTIALNVNGPRRGCYGGTRDLVIGMKVALVTGEYIKVGGKVVKNVAGYDMCKLFTGSLGTLGVITEATVRVAPVPDTAATIIGSGSFADVVQFAERLAHSQLLPAAMVLMNSQVLHSANSQWRIALWCEGMAESVARHLSDIDILARQLGLRTATLRNHSHDELWDRIRDFPLEVERCVYRVTVPRAASANFIEALNQVTGPAPALFSDSVMGTLWLSYPGDNQAAAARPQLMALAAARRGHAVMFAAPHQFKVGHDVWGAPPAALPLMRKIKQQFDPDGLLNPGRFLSGL